MLREFMDLPDFELAESPQPLPEHSHRYKPQNATRYTVTGHP